MATSFEDFYSKLSEQKFIPGQIKEHKIELKHPELACRVALPFLLWLALTYRQQILPPLRRLD